MIKLDSRRGKKNEREVCLVLVLSTIPSTHRARENLSLLAPHSQGPLKIKGVNTTRKRGWGAALWSRRACMPLHWLGENIPPTDPKAKSGQGFQNKPLWLTSIDSHPPSPPPSESPSRCNTQLFSRYSLLCASKVCCWWDEEKARVLL